MNRRNLVKSLVGIASITPLGYALAKDSKKTTRTNGAHVRVVSITDYASLQEACEALRSSNGGVVKVPIGRFFSGEYNGITKYMDIPNVSIVGTKMPIWNSDASELIGGSIIEGKFNVGAHNFSISDIGFDLGLNVVSKRWPKADTTTDYPYGGTWDGFAIGQPSQVSPLPQWRGFKAKNLISLLKDSATVGHGVLIENVNSGCLEGDIIGVYGVHGVVIKSENINGDNLRGYMNKTDCVIFKSDTFAPGGNVQISNVIAEKYLPNCIPHSAPATSESGIYFNPELQNYTGPFQIGNARIRDAKYAILGGSATGTVGADIQINNIDIDGIDGSTEWGIFMSNLGFFPRLSFGDVNIKNVKNAAYIRYGDVNSSGNAQTTINSLKITKCKGIAILAAGHSKLSINSLDVFGATTAYYVEANARMFIGRSNLVGVTNVWGLNPYTVSPGWEKEGTGNSALDVYYDGFKVNLKGLIVSREGAAGLLMTLPTYLRPTEGMRFLAYKNERKTHGSCLIGISSDGLVTIDDGVAPEVGSYISLDGISWKLQG